MRKPLSSVALVVALASVLAACGEGRSAAPAAEGQDPWRESALWVVEGDRSTPFQNGAVVEVGNVDVEIFVAPYPPAREGSVDLLVTDRATGAPVEDGALDVSFDMYMPHGVISAQALPAAGGHSLVPYKLVMPGEWRVDIRLSRGGEVGLLSIVFRVA